MAFTKATKRQAKLRLSVYGPSGAGKTYTSLRVGAGIASVVGGKMALVDTERGSASKYADRFDFEVCELSDKTIRGYCAAINDAAGAGFSVLIIDSLSHAWQELLTEVDQLAKSKYRGNTWSAWSEGTPKQRMLIDTLLNSPCHIIATMRSKTEWTTEEHNGKNRPVKIGLAPEQGKGIEYEFDMLMEITADHFANICKDRTGKFQDKQIEKPGEDFGKSIAQWLSEGDAPAPPAETPPLASAEQIKEMRDLLLVASLKTGTVKAWFNKAGVASWEEMPADVIAKCIDFAKKKVPAPQTETPAPATPATSAAA